MCFNVFHFGGNFAGILPTKASPVPKGSVQYKAAENSTISLYDLVMLSKHSICEILPTLSCGG